MTENKDILIDHLIEQYSKNYQLSDLHIRANQPLAIREHGEIVTFPDDTVSGEDIKIFLKKHIDSYHAEKFEKEKQIDTAIVIEGIRYRANIYETLNGDSIVLRKIETIVPIAEDLNLPPVILSACDYRNGLILLTGPTGSGKSTTTASMINRINLIRKENIITIEDPIEFIHANQMCIISQREIGKHVTSFANGLRGALREDPDIILLGEMRDYETVSAALTAAETGHLVIGTLHTNGAPNTINRLVDVFPAAQQPQARSMLSQSLRLVVTQQLFKKKDGTGRVGAYEVMVCNSAVQNLIRENKVFQIPSIMQTAMAEGMITMDKAIENLKAMGSI
jgi:twitching motility protein PilT|tara:strand:- start:491 stop:1501 length:1011 start_codon:yes stop_codon:yes gene_type:complete